jgi:murein DD-endopeptidase MepM/ murein hydrolase activator NlpD
VNKGISIKEKQMRKFLPAVASVALLLSQSGLAQAKSPVGDIYSFPVENASYSRFFGWQDQEKKVFNDGVDLLAPAGSYVKAWAAGTVQSVGYNPQCGWQITLTYNNWVTTYCNVKKEYTYPIGGAVDAGTTVGVLASPPGQKYVVLHWTLKENGKMVNPYQVAQDIGKINKKNR